MSTRNYYRERRDFLAGYKQMLGCQTCDEIDPVALDLHHPGNRMLAHGKSVLHYGWKKMLAELPRCEILCSNCHRKQEADARLNRQWDKALRLVLDVPESEL